MIINVDFDGVLVPNTHENTLMTKVKNEGLSLDHYNSIWDWYAKVVITPLPLNIPLLKWLSSLKDNGHTIRLWTNRNTDNIVPTMNNISAWKGLFDSFNFYSGRKIESRVEGIVIDNSKSNLICGQVGVHYEWK